MFAGAIAGDAAAVFAPGAGFFAEVFERGLAAALHFAHRHIALCTALKGDDGRFAVVGLFAGAKVRCLGDFA